MVSAFAARQRLVLGQVKVAGKSNEIIAIPALLDMLVIEGAIITTSLCAQAIRQHWAIENRSHYVRDGSFREDASRIRCNPGIFARLRSFATNIFRFNDVENVSDTRYRITLGGPTRWPRRSALVTLHVERIEQPCWPCCVISVTE
jgi:predicted transposase YbfD/YdcC